MQRTFEWIFDYDRVQGKTSISAASNEGLVNLCDIVIPEVVPDADPEDLGVVAHHCEVWKKAATNNNSCIATYGPVLNLTFGLLLGATSGATLNEIP